MEARLISATLVVASFLSLGASYRTENFIVTAPSDRFARQVAESAEQLRRDLAIEWLGRELPAWQDICPITVQAGPQLGAGGVTSFMFDHGRPFGWTMSIQGSEQRIIDSVLPHEITHTIFATHFGRPLPRWADEGACTTVEDVSERNKQHNMLYEFLTTRRGIAFNDMFAMREYPPDVLPLYAQGYSLSRYLIEQGGKRKFINYVGDGMRLGSWTKATEMHYGYRSLSELQVTWLEWVRNGMPKLEADASALAQSSGPAANEVAVVGTDSNVNALGTNSFASFTQAAAGDESLPAGQPGWYARVRDREFANRIKDTAAGTVQSSDSGSWPSAEPRNDTTLNQSVSRPQPIGRPQQIILEWSRPAGTPAPVSVAPESASAAGPVSTANSNRLIPNFQGTLWR